MNLSNAVFCLLALVLSCSAVTSGLDATFGTSGVVVVDFDSDSEERAYGVAVDSSSAVYAVGYTLDTTNDFAIAKLTSAGALDTSFNSTGKSTVDFAGGEDIAYAVVVQSDGKIVAVGKSTAGGNTSLAVARWDTDGSLDTTFATSGKYTALYGTGAAEYRSVALDSSSRILIAGNATLSGKSCFVLTRLTTAGAIDTTFGSSGSVTVTPGTVGDSARGIAVSSSRIYVGGTTLVGGGSSVGNFAIVAYSLDGVLDPSFGISGVATFDFETAFPGATRDDTVYSMTLNSSSQIVLSGTSTDTAGTRLATAVFSSAGVLDTSFGTNGASLVQVEKTISGTLTDLSVTGGLLKTTGSSYLIAANAATTPLSSVVIVKLTSAGTLNTAFATGGMTFLANGSLLTEANASALSGQKWVVAGSSYSTSWDFTLFRYVP